MGPVGGKRERGENKVNTVVFICKILKKLKKKEFSLLPIP